MDMITLHLVCQIVDRSEETNLVWLVCELADAHCG